MGKPHEQLDAWKVSMTLVKSIYDITTAFPIEERFGLAQQMRRAAVSIPSNIAEGAARTSTKEYAQFISIARGSLANWTLSCKLPLNLVILPQVTPFMRLQITPADY